MNLPPKGAVVPLDQIETICAHYGLSELWAKIAADPPPQPFRSDGCSLWFDSYDGHDYYPACFLHDLKYWAGTEGDEAVERLVADAELMIAIARLGDPVMAQIMFQGVRAGGHSALGRSFSWGFGRQA
jgi:hypothetical protein